MDKGRYQRLVGKHIYLSHTKLDIAFSISVVSQFMNNPTKEHRKVVYRIMRYLKMTLDKGLHFKRTQKRNIEIFSVVDWVDSIIDQISNFRYNTYVWEKLVNWQSKKQPIVA